MATVEDVQLPVSQRPEWRGFQPLTAASAPSPVVGIRYTAEDADLLAHFYGAVRDGELSSHACNLAAEVEPHLTSACNLLLHSRCSCRVHRLSYTIYKQSWDSNEWSC